MTTEFREALARVLDDGMLNDGMGADMVAVGVTPEDCREYLADWLEGETDKDWTLTEQLMWSLSVLVQVSVAVGVQIERARSRVYEEETGE